jgi:MoaA/NifB/PqqE/SkfB family radical SAM enzyme/Flp pilus assembly protein TadD
MSLKTPDPMPARSAPPKPTPDPAALFDRVLGFANAHYAREDWLAARDFLSLAVQINPDYPRLLGSLGSLQFQLQEFPAACATFSAAVRQTPDDPDLYIQLAMVQTKLQQLDEAKAALQQSLNLRPNNPTARQMLGDLDFAAKRYADAALQYCALLKSNPDGVNLLSLLGKCHYELRDLGSARWCFDRVLALEPTNAIAAEAMQIVAGKPKRQPELAPRTTDAEAHRSARIREMRLQINFDLSNGCNLNCIMCGNIPNKHRGNQYVMPWEVFHNHLLPTFRLAQHFQWGCYFEPLMTPYFDDVLPAIRGILKDGARGQMITNGVLLKETRAQAVVESAAFDKVRFSVDAASAELFEHIRRGARFARVIGNVRALTAYRDLHKSNLKVEFNFTKMRQNIHELPYVIQLAYECGVQSVTTHKLWPDDERPIEEGYYHRLMRYSELARARAEQLGISYSSQDDYQIATDQPGTSSAGIQATGTVDNGRSCVYSRKWLLLTLDAWGNVTSPCRRLSGKVGTIAREPLDHLLVSDPMMRLLDQFDAPDARACSNCPSYRRNP